MTVPASIVPASPRDLPTLSRLYQLYVYDLSAFTGDRLDEEAWFAAPNLERQLEREDRGAYLFRVGACLAGFALVNRWSPSGLGTDWEIAEFFVVRAHRRQGIGTDAARAVIGKRPGIWEVGVMESNAPAIRFWSHALSWPGGRDLERLEGDGIRWEGPIFRFGVLD